MTELLTAMSKDYRTMDDIATSFFKSHPLSFLKEHKMDEFLYPVQMEYEYVAMWEGTVRTIQTRTLKGYMKAQLTIELCLPRGNRKNHGVIISGEEYTEKNAPYLTSMARDEGCELQVFYNGRQTEMFFRQPNGDVPIVISYKEGDPFEQHTTNRVITKLHRDHDEGRTVKVEP